MVAPLFTKTASMKIAISFHIWYFTWNSKKCHSYYDAITTFTALFHSQMLAIVLACLKTMNIHALIKK